MTKHTRPKTIGVIGGDLRQLMVIRELCREGYEITACALDSYVGDYGTFCKTDDPSELAQSSDILLLPLPLTRNNETIHTPLSRRTFLLFPLLEQLSELPSPPLILAGKIPPKIRDAASDLGITLHDYYDREEVLISNAVPTAEGAVALAMQHFPYTLCNSRCTVLGYGRIGKVLARTLKALGATVTVAARSTQALAWATADGMIPAPMEQLPQALKHCQILFNTVPSLLIETEQLGRMSSETVLIDLASVRGIDPAQAKAHGNPLYWALSLPGKVAPATAGHIIKESITRILEENGETP